MIGGIFSRLARVRFTVGYVALLFAISCAILALGPHAHDVLVQRASTNLHNLAHGHVGTLLGSALVVDAGPLYFWLPFLTCLLALAELHLRTIRLVVAFVVGHIGATLVVAAALAAAVEFGWLPVSITRASDVGMSYGALAVLGAMTAVIPQRWRAAWVGWWVAAGLASAIIGGDFTDAGHTVAVVLGVLVSARFQQPVHWTPPAGFDAGGVRRLRLPDVGAPLGHHGRRAGVRRPGRPGGPQDLSIRHRTRRPAGFAGGG
jgi:hypothetical protein